MADVTQLDLSSVRGFTRAVDWIRRSILLNTGPKQRILELGVKLSLRSSAELGIITLFVDSKNGYLFAFRGRDKIYILRDDSQDEYLTLLKKNGSETVDVLPGVGSDHRSLGTFLPNKDSGAGMRGRTYALANLQDAARLADFSQTTGPVTEHDVAGAISVLVCMVAECARWPRIEREFEKIYFGENVKADEVFKVYDKAKRIRNYASVFPNYLLSDRIEKLVKRAVEVKELLSRLHAMMGASSMTDEALIELCLKAPKSVSGRNKDSLERLQRICSELGLMPDIDPKGAAEKVTGILDLCANDLAVRAAQSGVIG
ncbi:MAG TPA: ribosome-inactivating family protein [Bryobacteraceae bacterium]|jgi:hypothetical protein|nr:ribosome-inactivating family protein [Bryobacteraceae bacterium]